MIFFDTATACSAFPAVEDQRILETLGEWPVSR